MSISLVLLAACGGSDNPPAVAEGTRTALALLETTDLHTNVQSYDYFKLAEDKSLGFERVATLVKAARAESPNNLLFDNGDTIQGTVAISHGGLDNGAYSPTMENANWHLAKVAGIDAMLIGHSHQVFPNAASAVPQFALSGVDKVKSAVHGCCWLEKGARAVWRNPWKHALNLRKLPNMIWQKPTWNWPWLIAAATWVWSPTARSPTAISWKRSTR